jgi:hypothetical protein
MVVHKKCWWRENTKKDKCIFNGSGKECGYIPDGKGGKAQRFCCDGKNKQECACNTPLENPCDDEESCLAAMLFAEARGTSDECRRLAGCVIKNRVNEDDYPDDYCEVVDEGVVTNDKNRKTQFESALCICDSLFKNQAYCEACAGDISPEEQDDWEEIQELAEDIMNDPDTCADFTEATNFQNPGLDPPKKFGGANCTSVTASGCSSFEFFDCT